VYRVCDLCESLPEERCPNGLMGVEWTLNKSVWGHLD
jgi:hypothetical protein